VADAAVHRVRRVAGADERVAHRAAAELVRERRTLFVGMTRAMRALLVVIPHQSTTPLLQGFDPSSWNLSGAF